MSSWISSVAAVAAIPSGVRRYLSMARASASLDAAVAAIPSGVRRKGSWRRLPFHCRRSRRDSEWREAVTGSGTVSVAALRRSRRDSEWREADRGVLVIFLLCAAVAAIPSGVRWSMLFRFWRWPRRRSRRDSEWREAGLAFRCHHGGQAAVAAIPSGVRRH